jgi:hypothetical protein
MRPNFEDEQKGPDARCVCSQLRRILRGTAMKGCVLNFFNFFLPKSAIFRGEFEEFLVMREPMNET